MRLGFDLDGVVVNFQQGISDHLKEEFGIEWEESDFTEFWIEDTVFDPDNEKRNRKIQESCVRTMFEDMYQYKVPPYKDAVKAIKQLKKGGNTIHFITARHTEHRYETAKWLRKYKIPFDSLNHVGSDRDEGDHTVEKGMIGRALNLDFYIDDEERHLESMIRYKKRWRKGLVLLDKPWNSAYIDGSKFIRLKNWKEVLRHLGIQNR